MTTVLSVKDACRRLCMSRTRLYHLIGNGEVAARKIGRRTVILESEIDRFLASCPPYRPPGGRGVGPAVGPISADGTSLGRAE